MLTRTLITLTLSLASTTIALGQTTRNEWIDAREKTDRRLDEVRPAAGRLALPDNKFNTRTVTSVLSLLSYRSFPDSFGNEVVVGEVRNVTGVTLSFSRAIIDFYLFGAYVGTDYSYVFGSHNGRLSASGIYTAVLPPGETGFFKVWTNLPYGGITTLSFRSDAETFALAPVYAGFQIGTIGLAPNVIGGTNYAGTIRNASGSFTTFFTQVALAGYSGGLINDVAFTFANGGTISVCGTTSTSAVAAGATVGYSGSFLRPAASVGQIAVEWEEYGIIPAAQSFAISGGTGTVFVVGNCAWSAVSHVPWVTITSAPHGIGDSALTFSVAPNAEGPRTGTMTIAGQTFTVTQTGNVVCTYSVNVPTERIPSGGATRTASVAAPAGCGWSASSTAPWVVISSGASGNGNGTVVFSVATNSGNSARTANLTVAGQTFTLSQRGRTRSGVDFDGDGLADGSVFRPSTGEWFVRYAATGLGITLVWGGGSDVPVPGDYDGDGRSDIAIFRPSTGEWFVRYTATGLGITLVWGGGSDVPVPGDYDGDGRSDIAIFRPSTGEWFVRYSATGLGITLVWGGGTDIPVQGDYDGDGKADMAIFRPSTGEWFVRYTATGLGITLVWGGGSDVAVPGDYDGDGRSDIGIFRPSTGEWFVRYTATGLGITLVWGGGTDIPVQGDYDGDGTTDMAIFRPSTGTWFVRYTATGTGFNVVWGGSGDVPVIAR